MAQVNADIYQLSMSFRPEGCQRQAGAETRSEAESPEGKSIGIPIFRSEFCLFWPFSFCLMPYYFSFYLFTFYLIPSIIEHSGFDSFEAATS